jgi:regulator of sigma E protease
MVAEIYSRPDQELQIVYERGGRTHEVALTTMQQQMEIDGEWEDVGLIGIGPQTVFRPATRTEILLSGVQGPSRVVARVIDSLRQLFTGRASLRDFGGPMLIAKMSGESAREGLAYFLSFIAFISVNIACLNLLPVPALDGGHAVIILAEGVIRRQIPTRAKLAIQQAGMLLLLALVIFILWSDAQRIFGFGWLKNIF